MSNNPASRKHDLPEGTSGDGDAAPAPATVDINKRKGMHMPWFIDVVGMIDENLLLSELPSAQRYERSWMHRDIMTHVIATVTGIIGDLIVLFNRIHYNGEF